MQAWYVIECVQGKDKSVRDCLAAAGFSVWRPVREVEVTVRWNGRKLRGKKPSKRYVARFGSYLFIHLAMNDSVRASIRETKGVRGFLCGAGTGEPARVPDELIAYYRNTPAERVVVALHKGETGCINDGPFEGHCGVVTALDKHGGGVMEINIFGRPTPYIFEAGHVDPVEQRFQRPIGDRRKSA